MDLHSLSRRIDALTEWMGRMFAWLSLAMVVLMFINVLERYVLNTSAIWQQELVRFFHSALFLGAAGYTLLSDKHVRVDIFYHNFSARKKAWVDLIGTCVFMLPVCIGLVALSYHFVVDSWAIHEGSSEYNGMPGIFVLKSFIWLFAGTLLFQSISTCCKAIITLRQGVQHHD